jgi:hypothetical protein
MAAEAMLCDASTEAVLDEIVPARQQAENGGVDDQVQVGRAGAHRAIALEHLDVAGREDLEAHPAAMTAARVPVRRAAAQPCGVFHGDLKSCAR